MSGSKCKIVPRARGGGSSQTLHRPVVSLPRSSPRAVLLADYFRRHGYIDNFQRRSLANLSSFKHAVSDTFIIIIMMNVSETACLKLDIIVLPPWYVEKIIYSSHLPPKYASEMGFFRTPPPPPPPSLGRFAPRNSLRRSALGFSKPPRKCSSYGPVNAVHFNSLENLFSFLNALTNASFIL